MYLIQQRATTGIHYFAECQLHSAKALAKVVTAKTTLPSAFFRTLGKVFAECQKALGKLFETGSEKQRLKIANYFALNCAALRLL